MMMNNLVLTTDALAHQVEVFTVASRPVAFNKHRVLFCDLGILARLTAELNAKTQGLTNLNSFEFSEAPQLTKAYQCLVKAQIYRLETIPAIVIDGHFVAYGLNSVDSALTHLKVFRESLHD